MINFLLFFSGFKTTAKKGLGITTLVLMLFVPHSCTKDILPIDDGGIDSPIDAVDGGTIRQYQLVQLEVNNLIEESYEGNFGGVALILTKVDENQLIFLVDEKIGIGKKILEIPSLSLKVRYNVILSDLGVSVDNTLNILTNTLTTYSATLVDSLLVQNLNQYLSGFNDVLAQMNARDREIIAKVFQSNIDYFDNFYSIDFSQPLTKSSNYSQLSNFQLARNFAAATLAAGLLTFGAVAAASMPIAAAVLAYKAIPLWFKVKDLFVEIYNRVWIYIEISFDDVISSLNGKNSLSNRLILESGITKKTNLQLTKRGFSDSDSSSLEIGTKIFFDAYNGMKQSIIQLNKVIEIINTLPLVNLPPIAIPTLGAASNAEINANNEVFGKMSFSIDNPNLRFEQPTLNNNSINLKVEIVNPNVVNEHLDGNIIFSLVDEFNSIQGTVPIRVMKIGPPILTGVAYTNPNVVYNICPDMFLNKTFDVVYSFTGSSPSGGRLVFRICWASGSEGDNCTGLMQHIISDHQISSSGKNHFVTVSRAYCWGIPEEVLTDYVYFVSKDGDQSATLSATVPR